jgi:hypothetical protein
MVRAMTVAEVVGRAGGVRRRQGHRRRVESRISVGRRRWHQGSRLGFLRLSGGRQQGNYDDLRV